MNFNNYTTKSQETIQLAQQIAQGFGHHQIENEHIFKALTQVDENVLPFLLKKLDINTIVLEQILDKQIQSFPKVSGAELNISRAANKSLTDAAVIANNMQDDFVSIEHLILAIFKSKSNIAQVLKNCVKVKK
jgi:ATP-dependent Clp protease ATP-binding subunit ClpB